jgi:SAM-dependent methyltransferase
MDLSQHKDYFSTQAKTYADFRPTYPASIYEFLLQHIPERGTAWDCATGNGQVANQLSGYFDKVYATDISQQQLEHATRKKNIFYSISPAEKTSFPDNQFDLITVGQALHWFDRNRFYEEVRRVAKPGGLLAVWGYALLSIEPAIDNRIMYFYNHVVGPYWDSARKLLEDEYTTISFPFEEIICPPFSIEVEWTIDQLAGYLSSWSSTQKYIQLKGQDAVTPFIQTLAEDWGPAQKKLVSFPVFCRLGKIG